MCLVAEQSDCMLQAIRVQTSSGSTETAVLHLFEMQPSASAHTPAQTHAQTSASLAVQEESIAASPGNPSAADRRVCALHQRSPIRMYMFDSKGTLLNANKAALDGLQPGGQAPSCSQESPCLACVKLALLNSQHLPVA